MTHSATRDALKAGADVNAKTSSGDSALMLAAKLAQSSSLRSRGASLEQKNDAGVSALELVAASGDQCFLNDLKLVATTRKP